VLAVTVAAALVLLVSVRRRVAVAALTLGVLGALAGSAAYATATIGQSHNGGNAMVGPATGSGRGASGQGHPGGFGQNAGNPQLDALLGATDTPWSAAIANSSPAAGLELSSHTAVMAVGGFTGADPVPTLGQFQNDVANHEVTYFIVAKNGDRGGGPGGFGGRQQHSDITNWVAANFTPTTVGGDTVYNLTAPKT
jgi:hypothetical protein